MLLILLYSALVIAGLLLLVVLVNALTGPFLGSAPRPRSLPLVSVLVPARNEERALAATLESLCAQDYPYMEIVVLDDHSTDGTAAIIRNFSDRDRRLRLITGRELPAGWTGKNWACHQLAASAAGEYLMFTDADNTHAPGAVRATLGWMQSLDLGLLSAFPQQKTGSVAEILALPLIDLFVYAGLPLWLSFRSSYSSLAAANGQWLAFTRDAYHSLGGHNAVRNQIVEDVELSRRAKQSGIPILTCAGTGVIFGRMYHSGREVWQGFSKNLLGLTGYRRGLFLLLLLMLLNVGILPYVLVWLPEYQNIALWLIGLQLLLRIVLWARFRHPAAGIWLHPFAILFVGAIGLNSMRQIEQGRVQWKGRDIEIRQ